MSDRAFFYGCGLDPVAAAEWERALAPKDARSKDPAWWIRVYPVVVGWVGDIPVHAWRSYDDLSALMSRRVEDPPSRLWMPDEDGPAHAS